MRKDYVKAIFKRADLGDLLSYIKHSGESFKNNDEPYLSRLESASKSIYEMLEHKYPTTEEFSEIENELLKSFSIYEEVYLEIGVKIGAKLIYQLLLDDSK